MLLDCPSQVIKSFLAHGSSHVIIPFSTQHLESTYGAEATREFESGSSNGADLHTVLSGASDWDIRLQPADLAKHA